jgi:hypothetical protein
MQIYLISEEHGYKIAQSREEADGDIKNRWKEVTKDEFYDRPKKTVDEKRKPGRPRLENVNSLSAN